MLSEEPGKAEKGQFNTLHSRLTLSPGVLAIVLTTPAPGIVFQAPNAVLPAANASFKGIRITIFPFPFHTANVRFHVCIAISCVSTFFNA